MEQNETRKKQGSHFGLGLAVGVLITLAVVLLLAVAGTILILRGNLRIGATDLSSQEKIDTIKTYLNNYALHEIDEETLSDALAAGLLSNIGDRYAQYYPKEEFDAMLEKREGVYGGIGVSVIWNEKGVAEVVRVFKDSPSSEAGIQKGDLILEAGGRSDFADLDDVVNTVHGEEGTKVDLVLLRGQKKISLTLTRRKINIQTVDYKMLQSHIGYIQLSEFDTITVEQFNKALEELDKQGMKAVILDLRDNPGGDYDTVMKMADRVLPEGVIAQILNKEGKVRTEQSDEENKLTIPMAVLINGNSASASELFTGAIKDYDMATLVGTNTYGKGVIQSIFRLPDGSGMKFTTEEYLTPKGSHIDGIGVAPDIEVEIPKEAYEDGVITEEEDTQLQKAIEVLQKNTGSSVQK